MATFARWLRGDAEPDAFSLERDLHTMRLLERAYGAERPACR
jgi:predicted dehydrogenase